MLHFFAMPLRGIFLFVFFAFSTLVAVEDDDFENLQLSFPEQIRALSSEPDFLIGGVISPLSGQPVLRKTDLCVKGAQNIFLSRVYLPTYMPCHFPRFKHDQSDHDKEHLHHLLSMHCKGWQYFPHTRLQLFAHNRVRLREPSGLALDYQLAKEGSTLLEPYFAIDNVSGDVPGAAFDPRNTQIVREGNNQITVYSAEGTIRRYLLQRQRKDHNLFLLHKEILPNGKVIRYHYDVYEQVKRVESLDPQERYIYASLDCEGAAWAGRRHFLAMTGQWADYHYHVRELKGKYTQKGKHKKKYDKTFTLRCPPLLTSVSSPFYRHETMSYTERFLLDGYFGRETLFKPEYAEFGSKEGHYRVNKLKLPVGANAAYETVFEMHYALPIPGEKPGMTRVTRKDGSFVEYHFTEQLLPQAVLSFESSGQLQRQKLYTWDENHHLASLEVQDADKNSLYKKTFTYDAFGNPLTETLSGDLTGQGQCESFEIQRNYTQDARRLLLQEKSDDGKCISYTYLNATHLPLSKITKDKERIVLREFYVYDDCYNLIQKILDDGESENKDDLNAVTQRTITCYRLRQSPPFLHMPEWIEESYLDQGSIVLLKKSHLHYDEYGNVYQEDVHDANGTLRYTLRKSYDERGAILTETNRLDQKAHYTYDERGYLEREISFSQRWEKRLAHDVRGRLLSSEQTGDDGVLQKNTYQYDAYDHLISKTDTFSNNTYYAYDALCNQITRTDFPSIANLEKEPIAVTTHCSYDAMGRPTRKTDANGRVTSYQYNAYGSPTHILHPNTGIEIFRYATNGMLISHTDPDGLTIHYQNDILGRVLTKTYSARGSVFAQESNTYSGFHLLSETNKQGHTKYYQYDGAGRKIREEFDSHLIAYQYDPLSRLSRLTRYNGDSSLFIDYEKDLEERILEERKTDMPGNLLYKIAYAYDATGNRHLISQEIDGKNAVQTFHYDSLNRLIEEKDALGHSTHTAYDEQARDALGQRVLQISKRDPKNSTTLITHDPFARTRRTQVLNPDGKQIASQEKIYDPQGNLLYLCDDVFHNTEYHHTHILQYDYTPADRIATFTRAWGTEHAMMTQYAYTLAGKLHEKTPPSGITLRYSYDPLGYLNQIDSSDNQIHHVFAYDRMGYLLSAEDLNHGIAIHRDVDPHGNVTRERFNQCFEIHKSYDAFDRLLSLNMGDAGKVHYHYDPLHLRHIHRITPCGKQYTHHYSAYDTSGHLLLEEMPCELGSIRHTRDSRGYPSSLFTPYFTQEYRYDPAGNLQTCITDGVPEHYTYDALSQLTTEKDNCYAYDSLYNRTQVNAHHAQLNALDELLHIDDITCAYDANGNQIRKHTPDETIHYTYDPLNRLISAISEKTQMHFLYDPLGRRLSKTVRNHTIHGWKETCENYLYHGQHEIGAFTSTNKPKNLRILNPANGATVALELEDHLYAPLTDIQNNIRRLIDPHTKALAACYDYTAFGRHLHADSSLRYFNPWRFASKRLDPELNLINFGKRYYDPALARWLTPDPAGPMDSANLYQYVFNNPFRYTDPDGQYIVMLPLLALTWKAVAAAVVTALIVDQIERYQHRHRYSQNSFERAFNSALDEVVRNSGELSEYLWNEQLDHLKIDRKKKDKQKNLNQGKEPPYSGEDLNKDPTKPPAEGFEWRGKGKPGSKEGGWYNKDTKESLRSDFDHPEPIPPHWDYEVNNNEKARLFLDGSYYWD